jgi:acyl-CoA synthetase (AMP-forming)/AMP-acid ligase II
VSGARLLTERFADTAARHPAAPALTVGHETLDYSALAAAVEARVHDLAGGHQPVRALVLDDTVTSVVELLAGLAVDDALALGGREHAADHLASEREWHGDIPAEPSVVFPTSGSSGAPKLVCHSHATLSAALDHTLTLRDEQSGGLSMALTVVPGMPLWSISGFNVLGLTLFTGGRLVLCDTSSPSDMLDTIERARVTNLGVPPILLRGLVREQRRRPRAVDTLLLIGIGAGPVDGAFAQEAEDVFGCLVATAYGSTEVGGAALMPRFDDPLAVRTGSVGRALPGVEIAVDNSGELLLRSESIMRGTIDTSGRLVTHDRDGWYRTGDLVELDGDGNAHILGRCDDQISRGGRLIDPAPIEGTLERHPDVQRAAVVGLPSRVPGEQDLWAACVCTGATNDAAASAALFQFCRDSLPPSSRPRRIVCVPDIPLRRDGSPHRAEVRALLQAASHEKK